LNLSRFRVLHASTVNFRERWTLWTEWALSRLTGGPSRGTDSAALIIALWFGAIEIVDYLSGDRLSLLFFYLVPVTLAVAWFGRRVAVVVAFLCLAFRLLGDYYAGGKHPVEAWAWWNNALAFVGFVLIIAALHALFRLHRNLETRIYERTQELQAALAETRRLQRDLIDVGARERAAIGRDLHDDLGQHLFATALAAKVLAQRLSEREPDAASEAQSIVDWLDQGIAKTRHLAHGLMIASIDPRQLPDELSELAAAHCRGPLSCAFRMEGRPAVQDDGTAAQLFRIAQEAVRNASTHAQASRIEIVLIADDQGLRLEIVDDGIGTPAESSAATGMGLRIMSHRAALIGGSLSILPATPTGTRIVCRLPLPAPAP
jgi:signal transduction histidine kinase